MKEVIAVCPGSFDPITVGHLDIITRAAHQFSKVIVVAMSNDAKHPVFNLEERKALIQKCIDAAGLDNVTVDSSDLLLADYVRSVGASVIVKGLRAVTDFEYEFQMALTNKKLYPDAETVFLTTLAENLYLSSSLVKMIASRGGDISSFVPPAVHSDIKTRLSKKG